jgi:ABC-type transport system substrate-binding protein
MRLSRYDTDKDGLCDAPECAGVLNVSDTAEGSRAIVPPVEDSLARIGIDVETRFFDDAFTIIGDVAKNVPLSTFTGWVKDYADASAFMGLFDSRAIIASGNINYSLVGLTPELATTFEGLAGNFEGIPNVDADIDACSPLSGDERLQCWVELDKKIMEEVVPWVPMLDLNQINVLGPTVTQWEYDQASSFTSYAHVGVDPSQQ